MRKIFLGAVLALVIVFGLRYCEHIKNNREQLEANTALIEKEIRNVGKLIVTEGSYAQVFSYKDSKRFYVDVLSASKKALVVVNAEASISYDLSKVTTKIDELSKTVYITNIPKPELNINPNIEYYDVQQDYLNQFNARDYNIIKKRVLSNLRQKIKASDLYTNAENRLISELSKIYILTNSLGWTLKYNGAAVTEQSPLKL
ncbi:DUF4230 domain-containing protein [Dokdonia sp. Hel_I_53]|uniref:DUF4230 domain-containing protein n=1 Tax=Dokdonia sp. Hel_I_53 TaxID=1566287 RepID=UPI00119AD363|nr:DUF4230 domain-containing protein [Dokdonia sp. Hel_I_53]TVZ52902.1 uncharacterized protein DUF4230 [Dokdonia sp. Hel_I_53]